MSQFTYNKLGRDFTITVNEKTAQIEVRAEPSLASTYATLGRGNNSNVLFFSPSLIIPESQKPVTGLKIEDANLLSEISLAHSRVVAGINTGRRFAMQNAKVKCWECGRLVPKSQAEWDGFGWYCGC